MFLVLILLKKQQSVGHTTSIEHNFQFVVLSLDLPILTRGRNLLLQLQLNDISYLQISYGLIAKKRDGTRRTVVPHDFLFSSVVSHVDRGEDDGDNNK